MSSERYWASQNHQLTLLASFPEQGLLKVVQLHHQMVQGYLGVQSGRPECEGAVTDREMGTTTLSQNLKLVHQKAALLALVEPVPVAAETR